MSPRALRFFTFALCLCAGRGVFAQSDRPQGLPALYELGLAAGAGQLPDYPGSDHTRFRWLALPYFVYRGEIFRQDEKEGARARLAQNHIFDLDLSAAGSFPANSEDNAARRGMPDLDWLAELGPRLEVMLSRLGGRGRLRLLFPVRVVASTDFSSLVHRGFTYSAALGAELKDFPVANWKSYLKVQGVFIDEKLARYFYEVEPQYAAAGRPAHGARGGYLETDVMVGVNIALSARVRMYGGSWASSLDQSANRDSPLFKSGWNQTYIAGLTYLFYESEERGHH
ncbi:MAG TPA: MipA/OmpV family protein [Bdellovibrionales bacterium]|nr:MipA/OmpV family protein [Bdellovibrionales bacterium]